MRPISFLLLVYALIFGLNGVHSAHAMGGSKLNLADIQGNYETADNGKSALNCPENISVVYDEKNATLDGLNLDPNAPLDPLTSMKASAFHFANIDQGTQTTAQEAIPDHSEFQNDWTETKTNSDSVYEDKNSDNISGTVDQPFINGPMDNPGIIVNGQQMIPQMVTDHGSSIETKLKYDKKSGLLIKTVAYGDSVDDSQTCTYQRKN